MTFQRAPLSRYLEGQYKNVCLHNVIQMNLHLIHNCIVGFSATEHSNDSLSSMSVATGKDMKKEISFLPVTSPTKCAEDIVRATARREADVYYPYNQGLWVLRIFSILVSDLSIYEEALLSFLHSVVGIKNSLFGWF